MGKRRKRARPTLADDPHGWLVGVLKSRQQHSVKAQRAVTALTGFAYIAGSAQGAGSNRPFDHQTGDDSIRLDTKTQQAGVLDAKQEKPGKQFTAWFAADRRFIPVQLVLDGLTNSWDVVPGIPRITVALDPLVTAFDPNEPLSPFKIAEGCLEDLLDEAEFVALREKLLAAFRCLLAAKESLMKVIDAEFQLYLESTAEVVADNPELMKAVARNARAMGVVVANPATARAIARDADAMEAISSNQDALRALAANEGAVRAIAKSADAIDVIASEKETVRAIAKNPDAIEAIASDKDTMRALTQNAEAIDAIATDKDAVRAITKNPEAIDAIASDKATMLALGAKDDAMRELLGPELFELWKRTRQS